MSELVDLPHREVRESLDVAEVVARRRRSRGVPPALNDHQILVTSDPDAAQQMLSSVLGPTFLLLDPDDSAAFKLTLHGARCGEISLGFIDIGCRGQLLVGPGLDAFAVHTPTSVGSTFEVGGDAGGDPLIASAYRPLITNPGDSYVREVPREGPLLLLRIDRQALERRLARMLGRGLDEPVRLEHGCDLSAPIATRWHSAMALLSAELMNSDSLLRAGIGATSIEELVISTLLYIQPSNYSERLRAELPGRERTAVHRAIEFIEAHLAEPIRLAEIAAHAGGSVRSLQVGFHDDLGTTVVAYIRERRLIAVRHLLLDATPAERLTVSAAASRWGFNNPGTFAAYYRDRFGETPSQTLRRR